MLHVVQTNEEINNFPQTFLNSKSKIKCSGINSHLQTLKCLLCFTYGNYLLNDNNISYFSGLDHGFVFGLNNDNISTSNSIVLNVYF